MKGSITDFEIENEISNLIFAGSDTTSTTLTYLFWELSENPDIQESLYSEVKALDTVAFTDLANLEVLDAVINESLRVHPAAPASLSRISPEKGGSIGGLFVPAGVCSLLVLSSSQSAILNAPSLDYCFNAMLYYSPRPSRFSRPRKV